MEGKPDKAMKLLAKKIEEAAKDSAIKVVEEAEGTESHCPNLYI